MDPLGSSSKNVKEGESSSKGENENSFLPGFATLEDYSKALISQVMLATKASNGLPDEGDDFDYYSSFPGFKTFCDKMGTRIDRTIAKLLRQQQLPCYWLCDEGSGEGLGTEDKFETLVEANDLLLERVSELLDEASGVNKKESAVLPNSDLQRGTAEVASWNTKRESVREAVSSYNFIHSKGVERPQLKFKFQVDNSNAAFIPLIRHKPHAKQPLPEVFQKLQNPTSLSALIANTKEWMLSKEKYLHPYQHELETLDYPDSQLQLREPQLVQSLEDTPLTFVTTLEELEALKDELTKVKEFAVDLEHHSYRSYIGFVCLMQISTRSHDYLVDTLELRHHMHILLDPFVNPNIIKVFHGAEWDIQWLQRDLGLYVVNMFDTGQASRTLGLPRYSLAYLLQYCCSVEADKKFQLADWRIRPLPPEMIKYGREDTHYLLYIYDRMSNELIRRGNKSFNLLRSVLDRSRDICLKKYVRPEFSNESYLKLYFKHRRRFNSQQLHCLQLLFKWRDVLARDEDESTGFVLPNHMLFQISEILPRDPQGILACCNPIPTLLRQQLQEVNMLVQKARNTPLTHILPTLSKPSREEVIEKAVEATDSSLLPVEEKQETNVKVKGPPIVTAVPVMTAFQKKRKKMNLGRGRNVGRDTSEGLSAATRQKREDVLKSLPDTLNQFLEPRPLAPSEVLQMQRSYFEASQTSATTDSPSHRKSSLATPTQSSSEVEMEGVNDKIVEKVKKSNGKRKLSVREMGHTDNRVAESEATTSDSDPPPLPKKSKISPNGKGKRKASTSSEFKPFKYEDADFGKFTKQGVAGDKEVFDPNNGDRKKEQRKFSKSKVHQKFSERSQTYKQGKGGGRRPSWPSGGK